MKNIAAFARAAKGHATQAVVAASSPEAAHLFDGDAAAWDLFGILQKAKGLTDDQQESLCRLVWGMEVSAASGDVCRAAAEALELHKAAEQLAA